MTPSQSATQPKIQPKTVAPIDSLGPMLRLYHAVLKPLGLGLAGLGLVAVPMGQAQTTGVEVKLLEPAGLASVQSPGSAVAAPEIVRPSVPQVAAPEIVEAEVEPMPPIAEKPDPLPPAPMATPPGTGIAAIKPSKPKSAPAIAKPEVTAPEPETVEVAEAPEPEAVNWGPVTVDRQGVQFSAPAALKPYFSGNLKLPKMPNLASLGMMFPLSIPSPITSFFGWRVHPITGDQRVHTGTDIAAPMGTPVLAALTGKVLLADFLGGYGMAVALEHGQGSQQTLYAHLSELFVKPGQVVQKGAVIGRVGTTGNSTGPHLHFEMRQQLPDGSWIAVNAGQQLEVAMMDLTQALKIAKQPQAPSLPAAAPFNARPQQMASVQSIAPPIALKAQPPIAQKTKSSVQSKSIPNTVKASKLAGLKVPTNIP